jgi:hypothetical protein
MPPRKKKQPQVLDAVPAPPAAHETRPTPETLPASHGTPPTPETLPAPEPTPAGSPVAPSEDRPEAAPARSWQPDPFLLMAVSLGPERDGPRMRLYRNNGFNQMAIRFDVRPEKQYRLRLREDGWRWREDEGVWTKQLDRGRRAASQLEAERLFAAIGEAIRHDLGLEPQRGVGG